MTSMDASVALVTGAAHGIGAAVAAAFAVDGTRVGLLDSDDAVHRTAADIATSGAAVHAVVADVTVAGEVAAAVAEVEAALGPITALANVAGVLHTGPVLELDDADLARSLAVNTTGVFHVCRAVGRRMRDRGAGSIVTVASNAATTPRVGMGAYAASKAAAVALTRTLGLELAPSVRCNVVCPGSTDTAMLRSMWADPDDDGRLADVIAGTPQEYRLGIPLGRVASAADVASAVRYLAGDDARHITMQTLTVDGGATLGA